MANNFLVCRDHNARTCIKVDEAQGTVSFIPMFIDGGFQVYETSSASFNQRYQPLPNYPVDKAALLYLNFALDVGMSDEALNYLSQVITVTEEDREMAKKKALTFGGLAAEEPTTNEPADVVTPKRKAKAPAKAKAKSDKAPAKAKAKSDKAGRPKGNSAAAMFQELIMAGKLTDDEIFAKVQEEFGLDDNKRSYVSWYRNKLRKDGQNPPDKK